MSISQIKLLSRAHVMQYVRTRNSTIHYTVKLIQIGVVAVPLEI